MSAAKVQPSTASISIAKPREVSRHSLLPLVLFVRYRCLRELRHPLGGSGEETVEAFTIDDYSQLICFWSGLFYWGLCAWYGARLMLERSFAPFDYILPCVSKDFCAQVIKWTPRALGLLAVIPIALLFLFDPRMQDTWFGLRVVPLGIGTLLLGFFVFRKSSLGVCGSAARAETGYGYRRFGSLTRRGRMLVVILFGVSVTILLVLVDGIGVALDWRTGDSAVALGSWALFGGFILLYLPMSFGLPAWTPIRFCSPHCFHCGITTTTSLW